MGHRQLLLFDIDGTLITSGGAGEAALKDAMLSRFQVHEDFSGITIAGATDALIARSLLHKHNIPLTSENITALLDSYLHHLADRLPRHTGRLLPGILPLLNALHHHENVVLALLTGNLLQGAKLKLVHYGVWDYFEFGAFADDHHDRNELGKFACLRAQEKHGVEFLPENITVIGDTPRDIECGRAIGACTVAIATGNYSRQELAQHQPDFLFDDFANTNAVVSHLVASKPTKNK